MQDKFLDFESKPKLDAIFRNTIKKLDHRFIHSVVYIYLLNKYKRIIIIKKS